MNKQLSIFDDGVDDPAVPYAIREAFKPVLEAIKMRPQFDPKFYSKNEIRHFKWRIADNVHYLCSKARESLEKQGIDYKSRPYFK